MGAGSLVPCAVCGATQTHRLYEKFGYGIERCVRCGLVYANPRAPRDVIVARYSRDYLWHEYLPALGVIDGHYDLGRFDKRYAPLLELLTEAPGRRLLEVGSGAGFFLKAAERKGWQATGIELSSEGAQFARERLGLDVRTRQAEALTSDLGRFDAAAMFDTIEHLFDPGAVLRSMADVLAPGGLLLVGTPNFAALSRLLLGVNWAVLSPLEHLYYFDEGSLHRLLLMSGFDNVRFVRRHAAWTPQETTNFVYTHAPGSVRGRVAAAIVRLGARALAQAVQRAGRQDILLCLATRA
jgi:2-polyprenyl-3-methyl-5-hydroxy-6-metoxy-1,4-benzoquinol methylase